MKPHAQLETEFLEYAMSHEWCCKCTGGMEYGAKTPADALCEGCKINALIAQIKQLKADLKFQTDYQSAFSDGVKALCQDEKSKIDEVAELVRSLRVEWETRGYQKPPSFSAELAREAKKSQLAADFLARNPGTEMGQDVEIDKKVLAEEIERRRAPGYVYEERLAACRACPEEPESPAIVPAKE